MIQFDEHIFQISWNLVESIHYSWYSSFIWPIFPHKERVSSSHCRVFSGSLELTTTQPGIASSVPRNSKLQVFSRESWGNREDSEHGKSREKRQQDWRGWIFGLNISMLPWYSNDISMIFPWYSNDFPMIFQLFPWYSRIEFYVNMLTQESNRWRYILG